MINLPSLIYDAEDDAEEDTDVASVLAEVVGKLRSTSVQFPLR